MKDLETKNSIRTVSKQNTPQSASANDSHEDIFVNVNIPKCFGLEDNQLKELIEDEAAVHHTLNEFETHMKSLREGITAARAKTERCLNLFPGD